MDLRPAEPADVPELVEMARGAFLDAFGHLYDPADLDAFLSEWRSPERFAAAVADPDTAITLASENGRILGYCLTVFGKGFDERPDPQPAHPAYLSQLYCAGAATGKGLGKALMNDAIAAARARGCDAVQLSVYGENFGAQRFYQRVGFAKVADIDFWVGSKRDDEFLYELPL